MPRDIHDHAYATCHYVNLNAQVVFNFWKGMENYCKIKTLETFCKCNLLVLLKSAKTIP